MVVPEEYVPVRGPLAGLITVFWPPIEGRDARGWTQAATGLLVPSTVGNPYHTRSPHALTVVTRNRTRLTTDILLSVRQKRVLAPTAGTPYAPERTRGSLTIS
jgi:hypothetical protein